MNDKIVAKTAPGPTGLALIKALVAFRRDAVEMFAGTTAAYGPVLQIKFGPYHLHQIVHPDHIHQVLYSKKYEVSVAFDPSQLIVGQGLSTNTSDTWLRQRRMIHPSFHHRHIAVFADTIVREAALTIEKWSQPARQGTILNVSHELLPLNLRILGQILFSADFSDQNRPLLQSLRTAREYIERSLRSLMPIPQNWPTPGNRRFLRDVQTIDAYTYGLITERHQNSADKIDLLSMLMSAEDRTTGEKMSDKQLHDELMTILFAAREDPENALSWTLYHLARHPHVAQKLRAELQQVLAGRPPVFEDLLNLPYLEMVVQESMRIYPPTWSLLRDVLEDDEIDGYCIPKGSMVLINIYQAHRVVEFWPEPEKFDPQRFHPEEVKDRPRHAYLPFGLGPRQCIGRDLAMMTIRLILAMIVQNYDFTLAPGYELRTDAQLSLGPRGGVSMILKEV
jgi:cytochrome P450